MGRHMKRHESDAFATLLRHDAARDRPRFSPTLHERILRRLPMTAGRPAVIPVGEVSPRGAGRSAWLQLGLAAAAGTAAALAIIVTRPDPAGGPPRTVTRIAVGPAVEANESVGEDMPSGVASIGIDTVPMFDELEAGVREGVSSLAATLLDVPEWRMLADFDAAGFLGADAAP